MVGRKKHVRVHLKNGTSLEGFLSRWPNVYILRIPKLLEGEEQTVSLDGRVEIPAENVLFWQVL